MKKVICRNIRELRRAKQLIRENRASRFYRPILKESIGDNTLTADDLMDCVVIHTGLPNEYAFASGIEDLIYLGAQYYSRDLKKDFAQALSKFNVCTCNDLNETIIYLKPENFKVFKNALKSNYYGIHKESIERCLYDAMTAGPEEQLMFQLGYPDNYGPNGDINLDNDEFIGDYDTHNDYAEYNDEYDTEDSEEIAFEQYRALLDKNKYTKLDIDYKTTFGDTSITLKDALMIVKKLEKYGNKFRVDDDYGLEEFINS